MIFAKIKTPDGHTESNLYDSITEIVWKTFSPESSILFMLPFVITGNTYQERKESARDLAIDFQYNNDGETDVGLSYGELADIQEYFENIGRRYGLLQEFRENAIC